MPDHDIPSVADLDAAFRALEQDIAGASSPRAAGAAIATARRRRRTTVGGAVVGLALVVGAAVVGQGLSTRDDSVGPADLPSPAPWDASALTAATQGWTSSDWRTPTHSDSVGLKGSPPQCLDAVDGPVSQPVTPDPARSGGAVLASDDEVSLSSLVGWDDDHPDASSVGYAAVVASVGACAQATAAHDYAWDGAQGRSWTISVGGQETQHLWVVRTDRAVGVLWTGGSAGPVPDAVDNRVASALVAGLQSSTSFDPSKSTGGSVSATSATAGASAGPVGSGTPMSTVSDTDFAQALAGWDNAWRHDGGATNVGQVPCGDNWQGGSASGAGSSLGANGDQEFAEFSSAEEAQGAVGVIRKSLASCAGSTYDVTTPAGVDPASALVASGPEVMWVVQHDTTVGVIVIPGGASAPPAQVSAQVMGLMTQAMSRHPQTETTAPPPPTPTGS